MKKKLMMLLALSCGGLSTSLQAKWHKNAYAYYCLARLIIAEKIKRFNPFGKATAVDVEFEFEKKPEPKFKKYRKKYTKSGKRIYYNNRRKK